MNNGTSNGADPATRNGLTPAGDDANDPALLAASRYRDAFPDEVEAIHLYMAASLAGLEIYRAGEQRLVDFGVTPSRYQRKSPPLFSIQPALPSIPAGCMIALSAATDSRRTAVARASPRRTRRRAEGRRASQ